MSDSHFSPTKSSPRHISPDIFLQHIIILEHISPLTIFSIDNYLLHIFHLRHFHPEEFSPGTEFSRKEYLLIHNPPSNLFSRDNFLQTTISPMTNFSKYNTLLG